MTTIEPDTLNSTKEKVESNSESSKQNQEKLIDDAFYVEQQRWGTWKSYDKENEPLVTSLTEEQCVSATRFYLKGRQEGFTESENTYNGIVGGKL